MSGITTKGPAEMEMRPTVITLRPSASSSLKEITLVRGGGKPREITLLASNKYSNFIRNPTPRISEPSEDPLAYGGMPPDSAVMLNSKKIPRPPNAFMIFANEWRKQLAHQHPKDSNKSISVRLGQLWKTMSKLAKEEYYQRSRQAGQAHKQKYPGYVYNPKEARLRKALREQTRGSRNASGAPTRWTKYALTMNHHRQSLVSPILLPQHSCCTDTKAMLHEQVDRDNMLQSYPDYGLDLPYNIPSSDFQCSLDSQSWYPSYAQPGGQTNGGYQVLGRASETKMPVDWSTPYNSEQGNFIRASPQSSPYSLQNPAEVNSMMLNGERAHSEPIAGTPCDNSCLVADLKPVVDQILPSTIDTAGIKDPEQQVKELLASAKVIPDTSPLVNGKQEEFGSTRLPGFHQAFGSTEIGRFSQPDGFFEAAVAAENERKLCPDSPELTSLSFSPGCSAWSSSFFSYPEPCKTEPDLFGFTENEEPCDFLSYTEPNQLYMMENFYDPEIESLVKTEGFEQQDLSTVATVSKPPVVISQNDNCCVVLESSVLDDNVKEYFAL